VNSSAGTPDTIRSILGYDDYFGTYKTFGGDGERWHEEEEQNDQTEAFHRTLPKTPETTDSNTDTAVHLAAFLFSMVDLVNASSVPPVPANALSSVSK
jgi:hypothetical protein